MQRYSVLIFDEQEGGHLPKLETTSDDQSTGV